MRRRDFIFTTVLLSAVPILVRSRDFYAENPLITPAILGKFCSLKELILLGNLYLEKNKGERNKTKLTLLLKTDSNGNTYCGDDKNRVKSIIERNISLDFTRGSIVNLNGWIISRTEGRQCALLSIL